MQEPHACASLQGKLVFIAGRWAPNHPMNEHVPPDKALVGQAYISGVNCRPAKIADALDSADAESMFSRRVAISARRLAVASPTMSLPPAVIRPETLILKRCSTPIPTRFGPAARGRRCARCTSNCAGIATSCSFRSCGCRLFDARHQGGLREMTKL